MDACKLLALLRLHKPCWSERLQLHSHYDRAYYHASICCELMEEIMHEKETKDFFSLKMAGIAYGAIDSRFSRAKNLSKPFNTFPDYPVIMLCALHPYLRMRDLSSSRSLILVVCCNITPLGHDGDWIEKRAFLLRISRNIARLKPNNGCK